MVWPDIFPSFCRPVIISAALVMFDFCIVPCISYFNIGLESTTTGGSYLLFIYYSYVNCLVFYSLFIYLIIYLFIFAIYLFGSCVYFLLSFRWFPFLFVFAANNNRCYLIFIFYSRCKMGSEKSKRIDQLVVKYVLGGGLGNK